MPNDVSLGGSLTIAQNLTVNGTTTTVNTDTLSVEDPLIELARDNSENSVDVGLYGKYSLDSGVTTKYSGLFKDASDSDKFKLFKGLEVEPTSTVDTSGTGYTKGDLVINDLDAVTISGNLTGNVTGDLTGDSSGTHTGGVVGNVTGNLTGDVTGDVTGDLTGSVLTAAQTNITSVGTLSSLTVSGDLTVDTNTLYVNSSNNRVGIGTASPSDNLEVNGAIRIADQYELKFGGTTASIFGSSSLNQLRFYTNNSERLRIDSSGNVTIRSGNKLILNRPDNAIDSEISTDSAGTLILNSRNGEGFDFQNGGTSFFTADSSGRLGLGTSSPSSKAHIIDTSNPDTTSGSLIVEGRRDGGANVLTLRAKDASNPSDALPNGQGVVMRFQGFDGTDFENMGYIFMGADGQAVANSDAPSFMSFGTSADGSSSPSERMRIDSSGRVGIGGSPLASARLSVRGLTNTSADYAFEAANSSGNSILLVRSDGNVGIGTASPSERLQIFQGGLSAYKTYTSTDAGAILTSYQSQGNPYTKTTDLVASSDGTVPSEIRMLTRSSGSSSIAERMRIDSEGAVSVYNDFTIDNGSPEMYFKTGATHYRWMVAAQENVDAALEITPSTTVGGGTYSTPVAVFKATGEVGIGTTSPSGGKLHIYATNTPTKFESSGLTLYNTYTNSNGNFGFVGSGNGVASGGNANDFGIQAVNNFVVATGGSTERMRISSGGDVLIGTTSDPSASVTGFKVGDGTSGTFVNNAKNVTTSTAHFNFFNPNGVVGSISTSGSATAYNTSSDYRLKENVVDLTGALDRVDQLEPKRFNFIADEDTTVDGFLAHEVQDIVPEAVTGEKDAVDEDGNDIYQGIDQSKLVPLLVGAIKELRAEVNSLKAQINN